MSCAVSFLNFVKIFSPAHTSRKSIPPSVRPSSPQRNTGAVFFCAHFSRPPSAFSPFIPPLRAPLPFPRPEFSLPLFHQHCFSLSPCSHIFHELRRLLLNFSASSPPCRCSSHCPFHPHFLHHRPPPAAISRSGPRSPCISLFPSPSISSSRASPPPHLTVSELYSNPSRASLFAHKKRLPPGSLRTSLFVFLPCAGEFPAFGGYHYKVETSHWKGPSPIPAPSFIAPPYHRPTPLRRLPRRARASAASHPTRPHAPVPPPPLRPRPIPPARAGCPVPRPPSGHSRPPPPGAPRRCRWQGPHTQTSGNR